MCTLTWFAQPGGYQLFFNRDELRTRKPALPPRAASVGDTRYLAPRDGDHGGTWLCLSDRGLTLCLLNGASTSDPLPPRSGFGSRGEFPPELIPCRTLAEVGQALTDRDLSRYRSFVLAAFFPDGASARWDWRDGRLLRGAAVDPALPLVSSSFDSRAVRRRREELFAQLCARGLAHTEELHLAYHESHAPARGPYSPCMHRPDGETVSLSWIDVHSERVCIRYAPRSPCAGRPPDPPLCLPRRRS